MTLGRWRLASEAGVTLVELVVTIVVLSVALGGVLLAINQSVRGSADPMLQQQGVAVAEAYLEEILLRDYDEDAVPGTSQSEGAWGPEAGETRGDYDDVNDYHGLSDNGARGQDGAAIAGLGAYQVQITVTPLTLGAVPLARVAVTVRHSGAGDYTLVGYRSGY